ncbi:MFS transporter [Aquabacterium sp. J223]|uniref:MFS transporter n=1 Tax=Aquabacterium sp. J223 TaxID=2898431 RepID=UPI0021ADCC34|nr:MFS transporter [Aquabacterium sp. J223]
MVEIGQAFGVDALWINLTLSGFVAMLAVCGLFVGGLADRLGRRRVLLPALLIFTLGSLMCGLAQGYGLFLAGRLVQAVGVSAGIAMSMIVIADLYPPERRAQAMSVAQTLSFMGPVAGPVVGGLIAGHVAWQWSFALLVVAGLAVLAYNAVLMPETLPPRTPGAAKAAGGSLSRIVGEPSARALMVLGFSQFYGYYSVLVHLPVLLDERYGLPVAQRGFVFVPLTVGLLLGVAGVKRLLGRWTRTGLVKAAGWGSAVVLALLAAALALDALPLSLLVALLAAYGLLQGLSLPPQTAILTNLFAADKGLAIGIYNSVRFAGAAAGPLVAAVLAGHGGTRAVLAGMALLLTVGAWRVGARLQDPYERRSSAGG